MLSHALTRESDIGICWVSISPAGGIKESEVCVLRKKEWACLTLCVLSVY